MKPKFQLITAVEAEKELGEKYFYRQKTYRYVEAGRLKAFDYRGRQCFLPHKLIQPYIEDLNDKLKRQFPELKYSEVFYDDVTKRMIVDGIFARYVDVNTDKENEEDLLKKIANLNEWFIKQDYEMNSPEDDNSEMVEEVLQIMEPSKPVEKSVTEPTTTSEKMQAVDEQKGADSTIDAFPRDLTFIRVDAPDIEGVTVKSMILISLPSIAKFIGVETYHLTEWVSNTSFTDSILSIHHKKIHDPEISGSWKKGVQHGLLPFLPLEIIPELLVAFKQSGRTPAYPARSEQLYQLAKGTLEAVGLAVAGDTGAAAKELAKVSEGLGIGAADQVIEIFKRYESRPFQVNTTRAFSSKVLKEGNDIKIITGQITVGVTGMLPGAWLADGKRRNLPSKQRTSGREVMRTVSPADSVGVTFGESHYVKESNIQEAIETGKQGKQFYKRLKDVGLLDD